MGNNVIDIEEYKRENREKEKQEIMFDGVGENIKDLILSAMERRKRSLEKYSEYLHDEANKAEIAWARSKTEIDELDLIQISKTDTKDIQIQKMYLLTNNAQAVYKWAYEYIPGFPSKALAEHYVNALLDIGYHKKKGTLTEIEQRVHELRVQNRRGGPGHW